ncbi:hypothetical protein K227x_37030 [Rubripirellula lacrimiformis]|uniref:Uncharacterized protein n=1 Tax=Rubripirellula lacrimiformis TaxID=1930273 RepID=A0A517NDU8_9BACT|nr:hypothetical protein [Rubripirellula lacrimiformis]QDT05303.1 hypothetical protein K227x_37030 [Rubripirellula lacrimiformis]
MAKKKATTTARAKTKKAAAPTLNDIYDKVAARADTEGLNLNVAATKRVLACFFDVLEEYPSSTAFDFIAKGLKRAGSRKA